MSFLYYFRKNRVTYCTCVRTPLKPLEMWEMLGCYLNKSNRGKPFHYINNSFNATLLPCCNRQLVGNQLHATVGVQSVLRTVAQDHTLKFPVFPASVNIKFLLSAPLLFPSHLVAYFR